MLPGSQGCDTLVIFSSPHRDGFTAQMLNAFLQQNGIEDYHFFNCYDEMPQPCVGCNLCEKDFRCSRTDLADFGRAFLDCKRLIIATPIYNNGLPAPLKALLDRNQIFFSARFYLSRRSLPRYSHYRIALP